VAEHYTKNTVEVSKYCKKCTAFTMHLVMGGKVGPCEACLKRLKDAPKIAPAAKQDSLF
jgi:hypothetical protein